MKVFLDDVRDPPADDWVVTRNVRSTIRLLRSGEVILLSLDHDLGDHAFGQGIHVVNWLERELFLYGNTYILPGSIHVHSQNPVGRENMINAIASIYRRL